jgi:hypothetical protein
MKKLFSLLLSLPVAALLHAADKRPNIVWIFGEDGRNWVAMAIRRRSRQTWTSGAGGCAVHAVFHTRAGLRAERSGLITGYPTTIGTHHMRSN